MFPLGHLVVCVVDQSMKVTIVLALHPTWGNSRARYRLHNVLSHSDHLGLLHSREPAALISLLLLVDEPSDAHKVQYQYV